MGTLLKDLRYGWRVLVKSPGFTAAAILTLALGIGASTSIFSVVYAVLLEPLPYPQPQKIVRVWEQAANGHRMNMADPNFADFRAQNHTLSALAEYNDWPASVSGGSEPVRVDVAAVSQDFFKAIGVEPYRGREFAADEEVYHGAGATIVSYGFWQQFLGGRADFSSARLTIDGKIYSVIGVMPPGFDFPNGVAAWVSREYDRETYTSRTAHNWAGLGRVRDGATVAEARADLDTIARRIHAQYGNQVNLTDAAVVPLADAMVGPVRATLLTLFAAVVLLFLVACANVAGLLLARTAARRKELAVRAALGASRGRLIQQLLAESLILAGAGGGLGILLALWTTRLLPAILPAGLPRAQGVAINTSVLLFTLAATIAVAAGLGLFAAWRADTAEPSESLSAGSRTYTGGSHRLRSALVIGEVAATMVLLAGAGLLGRSFLRLISVSPGINENHLIVLTFSPPLPEGFNPLGAAETSREVHQVDTLLERMRAIPGVESAAFTGGVPVADDLSDGTFLVLNGQPAPTNFNDWERFADQNPKDTGYALYSVASADYFRTAQIPLLRGRMFEPQDTFDSLNVAVISQALARERWPNQDPIGQVVDFSNMDGDMKPLTIVGVVADVRAEGLDQPSSPIIYVDYDQRGMRNASPTILVRTSAGPESIVSAARGIFRQLDPDVPVEAKTYADLLGGWLAQRQFLLLLAGVFAGAALALAAVGIYGLIAHSVTLRTQEIGIRMALGAQRGDVLRMVVGEGARLAAIGLAIGVAISLGMTRLIGSLLFGVKPADPLTYVAVAAVLAIVALAACWIPARRAMRVDPIVALRYE